MSVHFFRYLQPRLLFADGGGLRELRRVAVRRVGAAANCRHRIAMAKCCRVFYIPSPSFFRRKCLSLA
jgi:hypothetical protein